VRASRWRWDVVWAVSVEKEKFTWRTARPAAPIFVGCAGARTYFGSDAARRAHDAGQRFPVPPTGSYNVLAVMVDFSDKAGSVAPATFDNLIFARFQGRPSAP
jgi:hypothetical protein